MLKDKCWEAMSLFTRLKNADAQGIVACVTCGARKHYTKMNAGHFQHNVLDFDEMNINCQCVRCNKWLHGNLTSYTMYLLLLHGKEKIDDLLKRSLVKHKYTEEELTILLPILQEKLEKVKKGEYTVI